MAVVELPHPGMISAIHSCGLLSGLGAGTLNKGRPGLNNVVLRIGVAGEARFVPSRAVNGRIPGGARGPSREKRRMGSCQRNRDAPDRSLPLTSRNRGRIIIAEQGCGGACGLSLPQPA